jgi:hypothetical protein
MTTPKKQPRLNNVEHGARLIEFFALARLVEQHPDDTLLTEQVQQAITAAARELARLDPVYKKAAETPLPVGVEIFDVKAAERYIGRLHGQNGGRPPEYATEADRVEARRKRQREWQANKRAAKKNGGEL